jgi:hypothetical protein
MNIVYVLFHVLSLCEDLGAAEAFELLLSNFLEERRGFLESWFWLSVSFHAHFHFAVND